jgi:phospholipid/cholesterol/gamma-HCH transport system ATP-binding protein
MSAAAAEPVIEVRDLVAHYGQRTILDRLNLRIEPGEIHVIMGGSGSGKTTLLRHLLGLNRPTGGYIRVLGRDLGALTEPEADALRRQIGVSFQGGALFNSMTVGENVALPLREHATLDESTLRVVVRLKLEVVNLAGFEHLMPAQLSGGMVKRAALARAIALDPKLLFFDEPSAGLDPVVAVELDELILKLRDAMRMTIVVVTHVLDSAVKIADRITVIDAGRIVTTGTVEEIRNHPDARVQDLLQRRPRQLEVDADAYLRRLTEEKSPLPLAGEG